MASMGLKWGTKPKAARLATRYNTKFFVLYVQTPRESIDRIPLANQRYLSNHFKLAAELGGEIIQVQSRSIPDSIIEVCREKQISTVCIGKPAFTLCSASGIGILAPNSAG